MIKDLRLEEQWLENEMKAWVGLKALSPEAEFTIRIDKHESIIRSILQYI